MLKLYLEYIIVLRSNTGQGIGFPFPIIIIPLYHVYEISPCGIGIRVGYVVECPYPVLRCYLPATVGGFHAPFGGGVKLDSFFQLERINKSIFTYVPGLCQVWHQLALTVYANQRIKKLIYNPHG